MKNSKQEIEAAYARIAERDAYLQKKYSKIFVKPAPGSSPDLEKLTPLPIQEEPDVPLYRNISNEEKHSICTLWISWNQQGKKNHNGKCTDTYHSWKNETQRIKYSGNLRISHRWAIECLIKLVEKNAGMYINAIMYNNLYKKKPVMRWKQGEGLLTPDNKPIYKHNGQDEILFQWELNFLDKKFLTLPGEIVFNHCRENKKFKLYKEKQYPKL